VSIQGRRIFRVADFVSKGLAVAPDAADYP